MRIMPDVHAGAGCVIGFTADLGDKVILNIVGVDIGCGMLTVELGKIDIDFAMLDAAIRKRVPSGINTHEGRLMSRSKAKEKISLAEFEKSMEGIYTTSVNPSTIDESPMAYKPMEEILENIGDTVEVVKIIKPVYNFKASE